MSLFGRDRLQPDQNPSLRSFQQAYYDALAGRSVLDDRLQESEASREVLSESESTAIGQELLGEVRLSTPDGPDPGRADWFRQVQDTQFGRITQRWQERQKLDLAPRVDAPGSLGASLTSQQEALSGLRAAMESSLLPALRNAWSQEQVKADLLRRHAPGTLASTMRPGLSFDGHMARYAHVIQGAQSDVYLGQFMGENPVVAAGMLQASDRGVAVGLRTQDPFSEVGQAFARDVWSQLADYSSAPAGMTEHFKFATADMGSPLTARVLITSANLTQAALGKMPAHGRNLPSMGGNFESSVLLTPEAFATPALWASIHQQMVAAQTWVRSGATDLAETLVLEQKLLTAIEHATKDEFGAAMRHVQNSMSRELRDAFTGNQTVGESRIMSGGGLAAMHRQQLQGLGKGGRAILISYNFGEDINAEIEAAVRRGADVTLMHGARWEMEPVPRLRPDTVPKQNLDALEARLAAAPTPGQGRLRVVQNVNTLVHSKVSVFETGVAPGDLLTGSMNLDDKQLHGRGIDPNDHPGAIRQIGQMLRQGEYLPYERDVRLAERIVEVAALTRLNPVGTVNLNGGVQGELERLRSQYQLNRYQADVLDLQGLNGLQFRVGGSFRLGQGPDARFVDLGQLMTLSAYAPDEGFVAKGFGRSTQDYFVPELSKFISPVRGVGWATEEEPTTGQSRTAGSLEVLVAGTAAAQREVQSYLDTLVELVGTQQAQHILQNPYELGRLRYTIRQFTKERFKNFGGFEPGTPAYEAKQYAQLLMRVGQNGLLDMNAQLNISGQVLDKMLSGELKRADLGTRNYLFTASGLSRFNRYGEAKTARMYDVEMLNTLPEATVDAQQDDFLFLMPLGKLAQLPQRLQNIISVRNLTPVVDTEILGVFGAEDPRAQGLVGYSRFVGNRVEAKNRKQMVRFRGYAVPGLSGDQNAYLMGDSFEHLQFGNEAFRKTVKIPSSTAIATDIGRMLTAQLTSLADTAGSGVQRLSGDRYFLSSEALNALESRLDLAGHRIGDTGLHMLQQVDLGVEGKEASGMVLDLSKLGSGLRRNAGSWEFTLTGTLLEKLTSGARNLLGAKVPFVIAQRLSPYFTKLNTLAEAMYGSTDGVSPGVYQTVGMDRFNIVFGLGTIKTGKAFVETGIEMLETGAYKQQLAYLRQASDQGLAPLRGMRTIITKIASTVEDRTLRGELERVGTLLEEGGGFSEDAAHAIERTLTKTADYLNASPDNVISLGRFGRKQHAAGALLAFGLHAAYSLTRLDALSGTEAGQKVLLDAQMGSMRAQNLGQLSRDTLPIEQVMGLIYLSFTGGASALATPMSSRNRVNLLAYHRSGSTQALYNMMARSPEVQKRLAAFDELMAHGLLDAPGDVRHVESQQVFADYVPGLMVNQGGRQVDPYVALQRLQGELEGLRLGQDPSASLAEQSRAMAGIHEQIADVRYQMRQATLALQGDEAAPDAERKWAYKSTGSSESSLTTRTLTAEIEAGLKTQTLLIPEIDPLRRGQSQAAYRPVRFLSRQALMSVGAFEDYAHEVIQLQNKAARLIGQLGGIRREGTLLFNELDAQQSDSYQELMYTVGALREAQRLVMTSGLQKLMGGMLALPGSNMIIGTLPEVELGTMVVSERVYQKLRAEAIAEASTGIHATVERLQAEARDQGHGLTRQQATTEALSRLLGNVNSSLGGAVSDLVARVQQTFDENFTRENAYSEQLDELELRRERINQEQETLKRMLFEEGGRMQTLRKERQRLERKARQAAETAVGFRERRNELLRSAEDIALAGRQQDLKAANRRRGAAYGRVDALAQGLQSQLTSPLEAQLDAARSDLDSRVSTQRASAAQLARTTKLQQQALGFRDRLHTRLVAIEQTHGRESQAYQARNRILREGSPLNNPDLMQYRARAAGSPDLTAAHETMMRWSATYRHLAIKQYQETQQSPALADAEARIATQELERQGLEEPLLDRKDRVRRVLASTTRRLHDMRAAHRAGAATLRVARTDLNELEGRLQPELAGRRQLIESVAAQGRAAIDAQWLDERQAANQAYEANRNFRLSQATRLSTDIFSVEVQPMVEALLSGALQVDPGAPDTRPGAFTTEDHARYRRVQAAQQFWLTQIELVRSQKKNLRNEITGLRSQRNAEPRNPVQSALETALGELLDSNDTVRALFMRGGMQRAGAPMGPDALTANRIVRQAEYNKRNPHILLDETLSTRGVFVNLGGMGYFLGDFDGDTGSIFNLADYTRLRTLKLMGATLEGEDAVAYDEVQRRMHLTPAEHAWSFARHYTGLSELFNANEFYADLPGSETRSLEANRAHFADLLQRAEGQALQQTNQKGDRFESLQALRMELGDPQALAERLFGAGTADALQFEAFTLRQGQALQVAESVNQYVAEMQTTHTKLMQHLFDNPKSQEDLRGAYVDFFRKNEKQLAGAVELFHKNLGKSMEGVTGAAFEKGDKLGYNVLIGYFIQTQFASSQVIAKTFEFAYAMDLSANHQYALDVSRGVGEGQAAESRDLRLGTILVLQQMAREAIKPKGGGLEELTGLREALRGKSRDEAVVRSIDRLFERPRMQGLNWLSILSTGQTMLSKTVATEQLHFRNPHLGASPGANEQLSEDATGRRPWYKRLMQVAARTVVNALDVPTEMTWDQVYENVETAFRDYHSEPILEAFRSGAALGMNQGVFRGVSQAEKDQLKTLSLEEREARGQAHLDQTVRVQSQMAIEMALSARGVNDVLSSYRNALYSENANDVHGLSSTLSLRERAMGFYALSSRGKFVDANAVEAGMRNLFADVDHLELPEAERRLKEVGFEVTGAQDYGERLSSIYRITRTQGSDLNEALRASQTNERTVDSAERRQARQVAVENLVELNVGTADELRQESDLKLFDRLHSNAQALDDHLSKQGQHERLAALQTAQRNLGFSGGMDMLLQRQQAVRDAAIEQAQLKAAGQHNVVERAVEASVRNPGLNNAVFNIGLGSLAGAAALMAAASPASASEGQPPAGELVGSLVGMALAYARPSNIFRNVALSEKEATEKHAEAGIVAASLAGGMGGAWAGSSLFAGAASLGENLDDPDMAFRRREQLKTHTNFVGHVGGAIGGAIGGTIAGLVAQGLMQRMGILKQINPMEEMVLGLAGFVADAVEEGMGAAAEFLEGEEGVAINGVVELYDEAGEFIDQTVWQVSWASFDDEHGYEDFSGLIEGDVDTHLSGLTFEGMTEGTAFGFAEA